jgi:hypothetical protein
MNVMRVHTMQVLVPSSLMMSSSVPKVGKSLTSWASFWGVAKISPGWTNGFSHGPKNSFRAGSKISIHAHISVLSNPALCVPLVVSVRCVLTAGMYPLTGLAGRFQSE